MPIAVNLAPPEIRLRNLITPSIGSAAVIALMVVFAGWTGSADGRANASNALSMAAVLTESLPLALGWLIAAAGFGWPLRRMLIENSPDTRWLQLALGIAALLWLDVALGSAGVLARGGSIGAWAVLATGWLLMFVQIARHPHRQISFTSPPWLVWMAAPAVAVLLVAATSAPGWLWSTEFGGYDALGYHLQLPNEWLGPPASGRIMPLRHNVYSYLPGFMEAAYFHLACLKGDGIRAAYACQLLHASMALLTAAMAGRAACRLAGHSTGTAGAAISAVMLLGTPWVVVVGSLGYNEMAVNLFLAAGLLVIAGTSVISPGAAAALGVLAGAACGAKLTSVGMVALPLGMAMLARLITTDSRNAAGQRAWLTPALKCSGAMISAWFIVLLPCWIRNAIAAGGNPLFPFATNLLGTAHWTAEQAATFARGHVSADDIPSRINALWNEFLRYGIGAAPQNDEPWIAQWSLLPWIAMVAVIAMLVRRSMRSVGLGLLLVLAIQLIFWLGFTHLKSRFLLPLAVPMTIACGVAISPWLDRMAARNHLVSAISGAALLAWSSIIAVTFARERDGAPAAAIGRADLFTGDGLDDESLRTLADSLPAVYVNRVLPADARVLLIGDATPLYFFDRHDTSLHGRIVYQTTWDRGIVSQVMRESSDDPASWRREIANAGFTHMLVDRSMIARWEREGWNDPLITAARIDLLTSSDCSVEHVFANGETLYRVTP